ncbi:FxSxx-COOH system tetratricopeptide repeat protein [Plantactinospora siamensis]|uniref:FxSxx-COOH system tetratricopeptide repeat protein n=1 Tax=Plantactinospora siamensis TaxID=555372 RepID=A0ABV6NZ47_9ACTN
MTSSGPGKIVTFYSYKGGTGRTMAVANTAWILASNGHKVLAVDWDLESPGLHRYLHPFLRDKQLRGSPGVIDLMRGFAKATVREPDHGGDDPNWYEQYADVLQFAFSLDRSFPDGGVIDFLPAGQQDASYSESVRTFDWHSFYDRLGGGIFLEALRRSMRDNYDYVLIDSRTGLSDTAGICTVRLPDIVVDCFTMSTQSIDGAAAVAHSIRGQRVGEPVRLLPVPMRVEDAEQLKLEAGRDYARARFAPFLSHLAPAALERYWGDVEIPYKPFYAYEEILAPFGDRSLQENSLLAAFERLAGALTEGRVDRLNPVPETERRRLLAEFERPRATVTPDVLVSYAAVDRMWAEWIAAQLTGAGLRVLQREVDFSLTPDQADPAGGLANMQHIIVLLSREYVGSARAAEFWKAAAARDPLGGRRFLIPIRLDAARVPPPFLDRPPVELSDLTEEQSVAALLTAVGQPGVGAERPPEGFAGPRFPRRRPPVWSVPQRNPSFIGRRQLLEALRNRLAAADGAIAPQVLHGLAAVGKSQVAVEYAHRFQAYYDIVWWVPAEQTGMVPAELSRLAGQLKLPTGDSLAERVRLLLDALRTGEPYQRWLIIFDNADDPAELLSYLPQGSGHVLVTTRNQAWTRHGQTLEIGVFRREESVEFLRRQVTGLAAAEADRVAEKLGDLPLAIQQAGAWLAATAMPVAQYLERLDHELPRLLRTELPASYPQSAAAAWLVSLSRLRDQMPAAAKLLEVCAFFAPEPIPMSLIYGDRFVSVLLPFDRTLRDPMLQGRIIREIGRYALARVEAGPTSIQLHRLVQAVIRDNLPLHEWDANRAHVHEILAAANPRDSNNLANWPTFAALRPHLGPSRAVQSPVEDVRRLMIDMVRYLWKALDSQGSEQLAEEALAAWRESFDADDTLTLLMRFQLANALRLQARYQEAYDIDADVFERLRSQLGDDHPYTITVANGLAADHRALGRYAEAYRLDRETYARSKEAFGEDDRTWLAAHNLGVSLRLLGEFDEALRMDEEAWYSRRDNLGERHMYALFSAANYGRDLRDIGDFAQSRLQLASTVAMMREDLQEDHPETLRAAKSLAVTLRKLGEFAEAYDLTSDTLARSRRVQGENHPDTLACALNLASDQSALGRDPAAVKTAQRVHDWYRRVLGEDHSFTLAAANNLGIFLRKTGDHTRAREFTEPAHHRLADRLGEDHPYTLACQVNLANDLFGLGDIEAAAELDRRTYERIRRRLGERHPETLAAASNLGVSLHAVDERAAAIELFDQVLPVFRQELGDDHPNTRTAVAAASGVAGSRLNCDIEPPPT